MQMASEAMAEVPSVSPEEAQRRLREAPNTLLIDVRDLDMIRETGMAEGVIPISNGVLPLRADQELPEAYRDPRLQERSRPVLGVSDEALDCSYWRLRWAEKVRTYIFKPTRLAAG